MVDGTDLYFWSLRQITLYQNESRHFPIGKIEHNATNLYISCQLHNCSMVPTLVNTKK